MNAPHRSWLRRGSALALLLASSAGCGPQFDPPSEVKTLRVLGVKKDKPYAQPGDTVTLSLLWDDAKGRDDSEIQRVFVGGCVNPPGDLYYGCFSQFGQASGGGLPPFGMGDSFQVELPSDIISGRPGLEPGQPRYGVYIVFFAVCAGTVSFDMAQGQSEGSTGLPIRCLDKAGNALGSDDFVVGYSSIYSFEDVSNKNPELTLDKDGQGEWQLAGNAIVADCVGEACQTTKAVDVDCKATPERCIATCPDDGDPGCPAIEVQPVITQNVEKDDVSSKLFGTDVTEQMWVNYYVDHGSISNARLLNDTTSGWNPKYRAELRAPKDPGPFQVWAVVHDNRGGMEFGRVTLKAR